MIPIEEQIVNELLENKDIKKAEFFPRFFKTAPGEYGHGDFFMGVTVPKQKKIANKYYKIVSENEISNLLDNKYHEVRLTAIFLLVNQYQKIAKTDIDRSNLVKVYNSKMHRINNWDLVDSSADKILGHYYFNHDRKFLHKLTKSNDLWENRIGVMSTFYFIRQNQFDDTIKMCERLLTHKHDLIHKATGWMLREIGNRDKKILLNFLNQHSMSMPRTMLRYAIEKLPETNRKFWLKKN
ncbi:MAG: DNA alkylation repair protein [Leptospira sp.]|nr:DNA alkylation repair protein [Leptospira sp.]